MILNIPGVIHLFVALLGPILGVCSRPEHNTNPSNQGRSSDFVLRPFIVPE